MNKITLNKIHQIGLVIFTLAFSTSVFSDQLDINGIELYEAKKVNANTVSSGQPTEQALTQLANKGLVNIINLRGAGEFDGFDEAKLVGSLNMNYQTLPIANATDINFENAAKLDAMLNTSGEPTLVHCGSGNRVGALMALNHFAKNGDLEQALQAGRNAGMTRLEDRVVEVIKQKVD
jgi:uncharacterized protein (TIGR01244 family)